MGSNSHARCRVPGRRHGPTDLDACHRQCLSCGYSVSKRREPALTSDATTFVADNLSEGVGYLFAAQAIDDAGNNTTDGPTASITDAAADLPAGAELVVDSVTQTTAAFSWTLPSDDSPILNITLSIDGEAATLPGDAVSAQLDNLAPGATYSVALTATDVHGNISNIGLSVMFTTIGANIPAGPLMRW